MNSGPKRRCRFTRRKRPLLSEHGKPKPDARGEVRRGLGTVDLGFPQSKARRGSSIRRSDSGWQARVLLVASARLIAQRGWGVP